MGNSKDGTGYGCELPAMVNNWRDVWDAEDDALFGIATLAAGGSEGTGWHMAGMRWSQTANYGVWDNPALPNSFGAQVYDLADPWVRSNTCQSNRIPATMWWYFCIDMYLVVFICWHVLTRARLHPPLSLSLSLPCVRQAIVDDGNRRQQNDPTKLQCCFSEGGPCPDPVTHMQPCPDKYNCSLPAPGTNSILHAGYTHSTFFSSLFFFADTSPNEHKMLTTGGRWRLRARVRGVERIRVVAFASAPGSTGQRECTFGSGGK